MFDTEVLAANFPPPIWTADGLIRDGAIALCGPEKGGKSYMVEGLALDITHRKPFLDRWPTRLGHVLYITKDDDWGSAQDRLAKMLRVRDELPTGLLDIQTDFPAFAKGGLKQIERWLRDFPDAPAVIIDTLELLLPMRVRYAEDYQAIHDLSQLGHKYQTAVICVCHPNKSGFHRNRGKTGRSWTSDIRGSGQGGYDVLLGVDRMPDEPTGTLLVTGKNVPSGSIPLAFDGTTWTITGELEQEKESDGLSDHRKEILAVLKAAPQGLTPKRVADRIPGKSYDNIKTTLWRMDVEYQVVNFQGTYFTPENLKKLNEPASPQLEMEERPEPTSDDGRTKLVTPLHAVSA